jgi:hypothetical protein
MTSPIGLATLLANVVVVLVLAAVARRRVSALDRLVIAALAVLCAWLANAALAATRPPDWTLFTGGAVIVLCIIGAIAALQLWTQAADADDGQHERRGDEGGGGRRRGWPDGPEPEGGGSEPSWWPEFEHRLASYAAERRERERRQSAPR